MCMMYSRMHLSSYFKMQGKEWNSLLRYTPLHLANDIRLSYCISVICSVPRRTRKHSLVLHRRLDSAISIIQMRQARTLDCRYSIITFGLSVTVNITERNRALLRFLWTGILWLDDMWMHFKWESLLEFS